MGKSRLLRLCIFIAFAFPLSLSAQVLDSIGVKKRGGSLPAKNDTIRPTPPLATNIIRVDSLANTSDSLPTPVIVVAEKTKTNRIKRFFTEKYPNPKKAMLCSLILPGAGQAYNRSWWKLPLVYGGLGGLIWLEQNNYNGYKKLKTNYFQLVNGLPLEDPRYAGLDAQSLRYRRDAARKNYEISTILLGLSYLLITAEAFVDAHLQQFDTSDDLGFRVQPKLNFPSVGNGNNYGIGLGFTF